VNIVIDLNGHTHAVAFADAKAAGENHLVLEMILGNRVFKQPNDLGRTLEVARRSNTNLNDQHNTYTFAKISLAKKSPTVSGVTE
jgi:hypothetical protein